MEQVNEIFKHNISFLPQDEIYCEIHEFRHGKAIFSNIQIWKRTKHLMDYRPTSGFAYAISGGLGISSGYRNRLNIYDEFIDELGENPETYIKLWVIKSLLKYNGDPFHQELVRDLELLNIYHS